MDITTTQSGERATTGRDLRRTVSAYVTLTKPRVLELLLVTTVPVMILAQGGMPNLWLVLATTIGGAMSAGSAAAFNMYLDRDIEAHMHRHALLTPGGYSRRAGRQRRGRFARRCLHPSHPAATCGRL